MKISGVEEFSEYILGGFTENLSGGSKPVEMDPLPSGVIQLNSLPSPTKMDGVAEIENILRLISKSHLKGGKLKDQSEGSRTMTRMEQDPLRIGGLSPEQSSNSFPPFRQPSNASSPTAKSKLFESNNADTVELLRQMLDKTLQALKICHQKIAEANKRHEASQLEIQKLQDEIRNLRAQANPPQLQLMKGMSSLSSGNKRRRFRSPSSSGSSTRSSFSSHRRSSRRSESPPQLSPAFIPRPIGSTAPTQPNKRPRFDSPHSTESYYSEGPGEADFRNSNSFNHEFEDSPDLDDSSYPNLRQLKSSFEDHDTKPIIKTETTSPPSPTKVLRSNMKNTSHLMLSEHKHRRGKLRSSSAYSPSPYESGRLRSGSSNSGTALTSSRSLLKPAQPGRPSSSTIKRPNPPLRTYGSLRSSSAGRLPGEKRRPPGRPPGRKTRSTVDLEPPVLENAAESESEEEFDAFSAFKKDEDESSEELVDIDDDIPARPPPFPIRPSANAATTSTTGATNKTSTSTSSLPDTASKNKSLITTTETNKNADVRTSSISMPSSPSSSAESNKSNKSSVKKLKAEEPTPSRRFRSSTLSSRAATQAAIRTKTRLRKNRHLSPTVPPPAVTESPFPPRQFDRKIDYSTYLNGMFPLSSENYEQVKDDSVKIKIEPASTSKPVGARKTTMREILDRFAMRMDESENCMLAKVPYSFYQSESAPPEIDNEESLKPSQQDYGLVEIPRWRERLFEPWDGPLSSRHFEENLDDQVFLKRHNKCEIDEKRRKRWDSQRMREESYLEKLKKKREERERLKKQRQRRRGRNAQNDKAPKEEDIFTFLPSAKDAVYVRNDAEIPISVFGYPLPLIEPEEFELPWAVPANPVRSPRKSEASRLQHSTPNNNNNNSTVRSGLKSALRHQPGKR